jgi:hypothetical protein
MDSHQLEFLPDLAVLALPVRLVAVAVHVVAEMVANDRRGY